MSRFCKRAMEALSSGQVRRPEVSSDVKMGRTYDAEGSRLNESLLSKSLIPLNPSPSITTHLIIPRSLFSMKSMIG
jgi:hypothetical protein